MINTALKFITPVGLLAPMVAFADAADLITPVLENVRDALNIIVPIAITLALIYFIWQVIQYVIAADEDGKAAARGKMLYGIVGLFVIIAVWGLVNFVASYLGVEPEATPIVIPKIP